jgi:recombination protein RecA
MSEKKKIVPSRSTSRAIAAIQKATGQKPIVSGEYRYGHVSTGSFPVDMLIGGSPSKDGKGMICPGFPRRRITELYGPESSGKTTMAISAMVQAQKEGGIAMFIDFEHALDLRYAQAQGLSVDQDKLLFYQPDSMEDGFKMMFVGIATGVDIIVVDSVAAMLPKAELEKGFDDAAKIGAVARLFSMMLPKFVMWLAKYPLIEGEKGEKKKLRDPEHPGTALIFVNQTRALIQTGGGGGHGDNENTAGGKALKFFAYLRLRTQRISSEFVDKKDPMTGKKVRKAYGNVTIVKTVKSKIDGKQGHSARIFIRYGTGIDDYYSVIETGVVQKLIKRAGSVYTIKDQSIQGKDKMRKYLIENVELFNALKNQLAIAVNAAADGATSDDIEDDEELVDTLGGDVAFGADEEAEAEALGVEIESVVEEDAAE